MSLAARLRVTQNQLRTVLDALPPGPVNLISICCGDGRDVIGTLAGHRRSGDVSATLLDLDEAALNVGRTAAAAAGLQTHLRFVAADATLAVNYQACAPAHIVLISGVFGHIDDASLERFLHDLGMLCLPGGFVIWNRHLVLNEGGARASSIRRWFQQAKFEETKFQHTSKRGFAVGTCKYQGPARPLDPTRVLFEFVGIDKLFIASQPPHPEEPPAIATDAFPDREESIYGETLVEGMERVAELHPSRKAIGTGEWQPGFAELNQAANGLAREFTAHGAGQGDRVALFAGHHAHLLVSVLAVLKVGGIVVVLNPAEPEARHLEMLDDAAPVILVASSDHSESASALGLAAQLPLVWSDRPTLAPSVPNPPHSATPDDVAFIIYTSGTTGRPKGVLQTHRSILQNVARLNHGMKIGGADTVALLSPLSSGLGVSTTWGSLLNGATLCPFPSMDLGITGLAEWLDVQQITVLVCSASLFRAFAQSVPASGICPLMRMVRIASEPSTLADAESFRRLFPESCQLLHTLSSSETGNITQWLLHDTEAPKDSVLPVGRAAPGVHIYLEDDSGFPVPQGESGQIVIRSAYLSPGYWRDAPLTARHFRPVPGAAHLREFRGGDLGRVASDGCLVFVGRKDHRIKIHGVRVELSEVEAAILKEPDVREVVAMARSLPDGTTKLVAYVVGPASASQDHGNSLRQSLRKSLPGAMIPAAFVFLDRIPINHHGKIDRIRLASMDWQAAGTANGDFNPPSTPTEQILAEIWSPFFENQTLGRQADFFQLGGDSLTAVGVSSEVQRRLGVSLELALFADHPILSDLAGAIDDRRASSTAKMRPPLRRIPRDQPLVVSYQQERTWKFSQDPVTSRGYTIPVTYRISGNLDVGQLRQSLNFLIRRHEILRTTFTIQPDGQLAQTVHPWTEAAFEFIDLSSALDPEAPALDALASLRSPTFDFTAGPLLRFTLLKLTPRDFQFLRVNQHIISDGPSWAIFLEELALVYEALLREENPPLREDEPLQYADYAAWQRSLFHPGSVCWNVTVGWWKQYLADPPKPAPFPFQRSVPVVDAPPSSGEVSCGIDVSASTLLDEVARDCRTTPFIAQLAVTVALLSAQMGSRDLIWGHYTAGRDTPETQQIFGFFGNLITLRFKFDPAMNFREWLASVRQTMHEAEENSGPGYEDLCQTLIAQKVTIPEIRLIAKLPPENVQMRLGDATLASISRTRSKSTTAMPWGFTLLLSVETPPRRLYASFDAGIYDPVLVEKFLADAVILFGEVAHRPHVPLDKLLSRHMRRDPEE